MPRRKHIARVVVRAFNTGPEVSEVGLERLDKKPTPGFRTKIVISFPTAKIQSEGDLREEIVRQLRMLEEKSETLNALLGPLLGKELELDLAQPISKRKKKEV